MNSDQQTVNDRQRQELLDQIYQPAGTVGRSFPETVTIADESIPLREFYFEVSKQDELREADRERVAEILSSLRRERLRLAQQIKQGEVDYETGQTLVSDVRDLDRAINAFESLDGPDFGEQVRREKIRSAQELVDLMREFGKL